MRRYLLLLVMACLPWQAARSQDNGYAQLRISCNATQSRLRLESSAQPSSAPFGPKRLIRMVDFASLGTTTPEDAHGDVLRTGSHLASYRCGRLTIKVRDGFFNANPQGEMGAADDYPIVTILEGRRRIAGPLAIGECDSSNGRYSSYVACPADWTTEIDITPHGKRFDIRLRHVDLSDAATHPSP